MGKEYYTLEDLYNGKHLEKKDVKEEKKEEEIKTKIKKLFKKNKSL